MYEVSFSELKTWRTCRQMYHYKYRENLEPRLKSPALKRGAWIHSLLEAYYKGKDWREVHRELVNQFNELLEEEDRKSTRLNSSHVKISYAVFCLKKKNVII